MKTYDLEIGLRVYPGVSKTPIIMGTKLQTFARVYRSLLQSFTTLSVKITVFSDGCGQEFHDLIEKLTVAPNDLEIIKVDCFSGQKSFKLQYDHLSKSSAKLVVFMEDDYILDRDALEDVFSFAQSRDFKDYYTFFNSSDYYNHDLHDYKSSIFFHRGTYWRTVASTTFTFLASPRTLRRNRVFFRTYSLGNFDHNIWIAQTKIGWRCMFISILKSANGNNLKRFFKFLLTVGILSPLVLARRENLLVSIPGRGTHLETQGCSLDHKID